MSRLTAPPQRLLPGLIVALAVLAAACGGSERIEVRSERIEVRIGELVIDAEVARTPEERGQGLSGRSSLPDEGGMLFVFQQEGQPGFWMREMRFPLDFIWISQDGLVMDLTEDVPPPDAGVPDEPLPRYQPDAPVLYVLEVNAGIIRQSGVQVGDAVTFKPDISP